MKHIHIKTQPPAKHLQIETITEHNFFSGYNDNHTSSMYDTGLYYNTVYTVAVSGSLTNMDSCCASLSPHLASYSQLCSCVDECEQTFLRAAIFGTPNTFWRWCCLLLAPAASPRAYAAVAGRSTCEEPRRRKKKSPAEVDAKLTAFPDRVLDLQTHSCRMLQKCLFCLFSFHLQFKQ